MKEFLKEFRDFAIKGNAVDMAVGIIIGAAFSKIVNSLVEDIIMPPLGYVMGGIDFSDFSLMIRKASEGQSEVSINYGLFITYLINFIIVSAVIFSVIKTMNRFRSKPEPSARKCPECKMDIPRSAKKCGHCTSVI